MENANPSCLIVRNLSNWTLASCHYFSEDSLHLALNTSAFEISFLTINKNITNVVFKQCFEGGWGAEQSWVIYAFNGWHLSTWTF